MADAGGGMNADFIAWLSTQRLPMFDIRRLQINELWDFSIQNPHTQRLGWFHSEGYEVMQRAPKKLVQFICTLDELEREVPKDFPLLRSPVGTLALKTAIADLRLEPWWQSAGPVTEEIRSLLRTVLKCAAMPALKQQVNAKMNIGSPRKSQAPASGGVPLTGMAQ